MVLRPIFLRIYTAYIRYNIGITLKTVATKPTKMLNMYVIGKIYIFEKQWLKKPTEYMFIQNID